MTNQSANVSGLRWVSSEGGPLLLLDEEMLDKWGGVIDPIHGPREEKSYSPGEKRTDYDRACAVSGYIGRINVGAREAIVLDDMSMQATWVAGVPPNGGMLARWMFAESDAQFSRWFHVIPEKLFRPEFKFLVARSPLVLFDSAFAGRNVKKRPADYLSIKLEPDTYEVNTAVYQPDARTSMVVHRFMRSVS